MVAEHDRRPRCPPGATYGKVILFTTAEAELELARARELRERGHWRQPGEKVECRWYPCIRCGHYHLTSEPEPPTERMPRPRRRRPNTRHKTRRR
jgi:rubrerythrin